MGCWSRKDFSPIALSQVLFSASFSVHLEKIIERQRGLVLSMGGVDSLSELSCVSVTVCVSVYDGGNCLTTTYLH